MALLEEEFEEDAALEPEAETEAELEPEAETEAVGVLETEAEVIATIELETESEMEEELEDEAESETSAVFVPVATFHGEEEIEDEAALEPHGEFLPVAEYEDGEELEEEEPEPSAVFAPVAAFGGEEALEDEAELEPHGEFLAEYEDEYEDEHEHEAEPEPQAEVARSHGPVHARSRKSDAKERPSLVFMATAVAACVFLLVVSGIAIAHSFHHTATPTAGTPSPAVARIQSATDSVDSATTAASAGLASLPGFPTPGNVANVINPYISSLQLYEAFMSGAAVPAPVQPAAAVAESQVRHDVTVFSTIDGLPPIRLGAYLKGFGADVTRLQSALNTLEQSLRTQTSS